MKTLSTNEWVAVVVSVFIVGFFFFFGQSLISLFSGSDSQNSMPVSPQVGLQDTTIGVGDTAMVGDQVTVNYVGHFVDGTIFDSSVERKEPVQFVIGAGQVSGGWGDSVEGMRVGGKRIISVPPELGYGMNDYGPIPGGSTLIFEVELLKVEKI